MLASHTAQHTSAPRGRLCTASRVLRPLRQPGPAHRCRFTFLVKIYLQAQESPGSTSQRSLPQSVAYLTAPDQTRCPAQRAADFLHPEHYTMAWAHVATRVIVTLSTVLIQTRSLEEQSRQDTVQESHASGPHKAGR
ncbi:hypothetical protein CB1_000265016 [Camelus ferus]|nr:hypothetical protein CB1_000265016 [Camelus ferus]